MKLYTSRLAKFIKRLIKNDMEPYSSKYKKLEEEELTEEQLQLRSKEELENYIRDGSLPASNKLRVNVYNMDGTFQSVWIFPKDTAADVCSRLTKQYVDKYFQWTLVECWRVEGIVRTLESHDNVFESIRQMGTENNRYFGLNLDGNMFEMFVNPENYQLYRNADFTEEINASVTRKVLRCQMSPLNFTMVKLYDSRTENPQWQEKVLLLLENKLYTFTTFQECVAFCKIFAFGFANGKMRFRNRFGLRKKGYASSSRFFMNNPNPRKRFFNRGASSSALTRQRLNTAIEQNLDPRKHLWVDLDHYKVYANTENLLIPAPSPSNICLVAPNGTKLFISLKNRKGVNQWMSAMRLSKYGKQLKDNYRAFFKKHGHQNDYDLNKKPVPNDNMQSHVAMDFSGKVGRIVEDPEEALAIAQAENFGSRRGLIKRCRPNCLQEQLRIIERDVHLAQPWFRKNMTRHESELALIGPEHKEGAFLVRPSQRVCCMFVLTYKYDGRCKFKHIDVHLSSSGSDLVCFTMDNGVTRFYDLLQLVEFYQLNAGCLHTRLIQYGTK